MLTRRRQSGAFQWFTAGGRGIAETAEKDVYGIFLFVRPTHMPLLLQFTTTTYFNIIIITLLHTEFVRQRVDPVPEARVYWMKGGVEGTDGRTYDERHEAARAARDIRALTHARVVLPATGRSYGTRPVSRQWQLERKKIVCRRNNVKIIRKLKKKNTDNNGNKQSARTEGTTTNTTQTVNNHIHRYRLLGLPYLCVVAVDWRWRRRRRHALIGHRQRWRRRWRGGRRPVFAHYLRDALDNKNRTERKANRTETDGRTRAPRRARKGDGSRQFRLGTQWHIRGERGARARARTHTLAPIHTRTRTIRYANFP